MTLNNSGYSAFKLLALFGLLALLCLPTVNAVVNDTDGDGVVDTVDQDDDNDGIPDRDELQPGGAERDSDGDGMPDRLDLDSDNDGILDVQESGVFLNVNFEGRRVVNGRILAPVGDNGLADFIETFTDSSFISYRLQNTDEADGDVLPDYLDLDSDNDGLLDILEAGLPPERDTNRDGRIDAGAVGADGILDAAQLNNDANCCDYDFDSIEDQTPLNSDGGDLPDYQDLDSDNDGFLDIIEAGGTDIDQDGRVDQFFDDANNPDGVDDALMVVPWPVIDSNADGTPDFRDFNTHPVEPLPVTQQPEQQPVQQAPLQPPVAGGESVGQTDSAGGAIPGETDTGTSNSGQSEGTGSGTDTAQSGISDPAAGVPLDDPLAASGVIETGLAGGTGCSFARSAAPGAKAAAFDPVLLLLTLFSCGYLLMRRRKVYSLCRSRADSTR